MIQFLRLLVCAALLCALQAGPATTNPAPEFAETQSEMRVYIDHYTADYGLLRRYQSIELSPERTERLKRFYTEWLERLPALNFDSFSEDGKIDYLLFQGHLQHELRQLDLAAKNQAEAASLVPFSQAIIDLEVARRRMDPVDGKKSAAVLSGLTKQVADLRRSTEATLKTAAPSKTVANRAAAETVTLRAILKHWFDFYNGYDPLFTWWAAESFKSADASLRDYAVFLREQVAGVKGGASDLDSMAAIAARRNGAPTGPPAASGSAAPPANTMSRMDTTEDIIGDPIGRDGLMSELSNEMIPYTPEELIEIANKHFTWCEEQMKKASNELGYGDDWKKALEHVKNMYVEPGKQPQAIRDLAREAEGSWTSTTWSPFRR